MGARLMSALGRTTNMAGGGEVLEMHRPDVPALGFPAAPMLQGIGRRLQVLTRAVESEVVPRLLLAQRGLLGSRSSPLSAYVIAQEEIDLLGEELLAVSSAPASEHLAALVAREVPVEQLYLELMAPAARRLGELWLLDRCHFTEVTLGLWRLQTLLHEMSPSFLHECGACPGDCRRALMTAPQGEQHTFGMSMVGEFLRRAGWDVVDSASGPAAEVTALVRRNWFAVVGLTASSEPMLDALASMIRSIRRNSQNPAIGILVGGTLFTEQPDLVLRVGADATAPDAQQAVLQAEALLKLLVEQAYAQTVHA